MRRHINSGRRTVRLTDIPWITEDGSLDPTKFPIEGLLRQALNEQDDRFRSACVMLRLMCAAGRAEAGIFLLGLLQFYRENMKRLAVVVENLAAFHTTQSVQALVNELRRVKSENSTRRYLKSVLDALSYFPSGLAERSVRALAEDESFSTNMRQKINTVLEQLPRHTPPLMNGRGHG